MNGFLARSKPASLVTCSWNCKGLGSTLTVCRFWRYDLVYTRTWYGEKKSRWLCSQCNAMDGICQSCYGTTRKTKWRVTFTMEGRCRSTSNFILTKLHRSRGGSKGKKTNITFVYGHPTRSKRKEVLEKIPALQNGSDVPWETSMTSSRIQRKYEDYPVTKALFRISNPSCLKIDSLKFEIRGTLYHGEG